MPPRLLPLLLTCGGTALLVVLSTGCTPAPPAPTPPTPPAKTFHEQVFTEVVPAGYQGPLSCQICHADIAQNLLTTGHWQWQGTSVNIVGHEDGINGKQDLLNSFYIGVPSNEAFCSQCHISYDWRGKDFDFSSTARIDCFVCHASTPLYRKDPTAHGGGGVAALQVGDDLTVVGPEQMQQVVYNVALPARQNCGACHFFADGGDNVKHGDMSSDLANPSRELDVHMGGLDFACQTCHTQQNHGIAGWTLHSVDEGGAPPVCTRCHGETNVHTANPGLDDLLNLHLQRVACESCHIPTFARTRPTLVGWFWDTAGQDISPIPTDALGQPTYAKQMGTLEWAQNVRPAYHWHNGKWQRNLVGVADTFTNAGTLADPIVLAAPVATAADPNAKVYPFKVMVGRQPADTIARRLIAPHLFGSAAGPNPYWTQYNWLAALAEGAAYSGVPFSGEFGFPNTVMYLELHHEIPPKEQALFCESCHGVPEFWAQIGIRDPLAPGP